MIPEAHPTPAASGPDGQSRLTSFRRGKLLVLVMVAVTAVFLLQSDVRSLLAHGLHGVTLDRAAGWIMDGCLFWYVLQGGPIARGCFGFMYGIGFLAFLMVAAVMIGSYFPSGANASAVEVNRGLDAVAALILLGAWSSFSLWVLLISKDARLYMKLRRQGVSENDINAFEWPPPRRR